MSDLKIAFIALGAPVTQGSKNAFPIYRGSAKDGSRVFTGKVALTDTAAGLKEWRKTMTAAARQERDRLEALGNWTQLSGPVRVCVTFCVPAPKRIPAERLGWPCTKPDVDKYARAVLDSLTDALVWGDDGQVVRLEATKLYGSLPVPGVLVEVFTLTAVEQAEALRAAQAVAAVYLT